MKDWNTQRKIAATASIFALLVVGFINTRSSDNGMSDLSKNSNRIPAPQVRESRREVLQDPLAQKVMALTRIRRDLDFRGIDINNLQLPQNIADTLVELIATNRINREQLESVLNKYAQNIIDIYIAVNNETGEQGDAYNNLMQNQKELIVTAAMSSVEG